MSIDCRMIPAIPLFAWTSRANSLLEKCARQSRWDRATGSSWITNTCAMAWLRSWSKWNRLRGNAMLRSPSNAPGKTGHALSKGCLRSVTPHALKVRLVVDNLNIHQAASLYETFPPAEARRLTERIEIHYTPKHGSWLNIAEIELSALNSQCLKRRIASIDLMRREVSAWQHHRNQRGAPIHWRFTTEDARIKLLRLYPKL